MSRNAKRSRVELRRSFLDRRSDRQEWEPHVGTRKSTRTAEQRPRRMEETEEERKRQKRRAGPSRTQPPDGTKAHPGKREVIRAFVPSSTLPWRLPSPMEASVSVHISPRIRVRVAAKHKQE